MFLKFSNGQYIRSRYIESFNFYEQRDFDKKEKHIHIKTCSGTMFRFSYCGKYDDLNEVDYESDKAILENLVEDRMKED